MANRQDLKRGVELALAGDWDGAHAIAQREEANPVACWLHACLHKMEGDTGNARYWYARSGRTFADFRDPQAELAAITAALDDLK